MKLDNRPKCSHCGDAPADVIEYDYLLSCASCWNDRNIPKGWSPKMSRRDKITDGRNTA